MIKDNQRVTLTKRLLKEALLRLLETKHLDKISITELCKEAGINRATFYRHYELPQNVLYDIEKDLVKELLSLASKPDTPEEAKSFVEKICTYMYEHSDLIKILFRYNTDLDLTLVIDDLYPIILNLTQKGHKVDDMDSDSFTLITSYYAGGIYSLLRKWLMEDVPKTPTEITELLFSYASIV